MAALRRKRLNRRMRVRVAKQWLAAYSGSDLVRGYRTWFGVSEVCAIVELRMLGIQIAEDRLEQARRKEQARAARRQQRRQGRPQGDGRDGGSAWADGCTPAGFPYAMEQDEADAAWEQALAWSRVSNEMDEDDDLPF
jgi:hypothetical protein